MTAPKLTSFAPPQGGAEGPSGGRAGPPTQELLRLKDVHAWYGESHILHGIDLTVNRGEVVTLLGRNGAGRTTTLKAILGLVGRRSGSIMVNGTEAVHLPPQVAPGGLSMDEVFRLFPNLRERLRSQGPKLSGGEQQMLAIGRILRTGARLLLLDEPTEGLAPVIVEQIGRTIAELKRKGFTILLVEQNFRFAQKVADRHYIVENGRVVDMVPGAELEANMHRVHEYLGV